MPSSSSRHHSHKRDKRGLRHHWRHNRGIYLPLLGFLAIAVVMGSVYFATRKPEATEEQLQANRASMTETDRTLMRHAAAEAVPFPAEFTLENLVDRIFAAYGGRSNSLALSSMRREGIILIPEQPEIEITSFWKAPDAMRYTLDLKEFSLRRSYNGQTVSESRLRKGRVVDAREITGEEKERFIRNARISQPAVYSLQQLDRLELREDTVINGRESYAIGLLSRRYRETLYFDKGSFLCVQRERIDEDLSGDPKRITIQFDDFRVVDGVIQNFGQLLFGDGELINEIRTSKLSPNAGLLSDAFDPPPEMKRGN
jgi:hypothetical protein